jgi:hypothetical protein
MKMVPGVALIVFTVGLLGELAGGWWHPAGEPSGANMPQAHAPLTAGDGPPNAYIEFGRPGRWMTQGSSCWSSGDSERCADMAPVEDLSLPGIVVRRGSVGRIHLGFDPTSAELDIGKTSVHVGAGRTISFAALRPGMLDLYVNRGNDEVTYFARLVVR